MDLWAVSLNLAACMSLQLKTQLEDAQAAQHAASSQAAMAQQEAATAAAELERHRAQALAELQGWQAKHEELLRVGLFFWVCFWWPCTYADMLVFLATPQAHNEQLSKLQKELDVSYQTLNDMQVGVHDQCFDDLY
jgi:hypothetical protein